ncbi:hypothetical protein [Photobacterium kishitanii]|uniref:hypothetical protein n=1 Tax=Photobacterium kishitanii TaxID=318456 RepID=UPI001269C420|nr:hypothetical protein [Photobacterium kishitanii]
MLTLSSMTGAVDFLMALSAVFETAWRASVANEAASVPDFAGSVVVDGNTVLSLWLAPISKQDFR